MNPGRGKILVRAVETEECIPGGRVILTQKSRENYAANQMFIISVSSGEFCDDEDCSRFHYREASPERFGDDAYNVHPLDPRIQPGAWCIVEPRSLVDSGSETERTYFVRQDDILAVLRVGDLGRAQQSV